MDVIAAIAKEFMGENPETSGSDTSIFHTVTATTIVLGKKVHYGV